MYVCVFVVHVHYKHTTFCPENRELYLRVNFLVKYCFKVQAQLFSGQREHAYRARTCYAFSSLKAFNNLILALLISGHKPLELSTNSHW